jgi:hypothetical protein
MSAVFSQVLADRIHELERDLRDTRGKLRKALYSRDLWQHRYRVAASAARGLNRPASPYTRQSNTTDPNGDDLDSQNAGRVS